MQHLHSHFVQMQHISHSDCINKMLVMNTCQQNNEFIWQINLMSWSQS